MPKFKLHVAETVQRVLIVDYEVSKAEVVKELNLDEFDAAGWHDHIPRYFRLKYGDLPLKGKVLNVSRDNQVEYVEEVSP